MGNRIKKLLRKEVLPEKPKSRWRGTWFFRLRRRRGKETDVDCSDNQRREEVYQMCREAVLNCFPDMCHEYLVDTLAQFKNDHQQVITHVLDKQEKGEPYPRQPKSLKRKREDKGASEDDAGLEDIRKAFEEPDPDRRPMNRGPLYMRQYSKTA